MKIYRPLTVFIGVLLVLGGGLVRLGDPERLLNNWHRTEVKAGMGEKIEGRNFTLTVNRMTFAKTIVEHPDDSDEAPIRTDGVFVAIEYEVSGRHEEGTAGEMTLTTDQDTIYEPVNAVIRTGLDIPAPGYTESTFQVFELNPRDVTGLTLHIRPTTFWTTQQTDYAIDLAIPSQSVAQAMIRKAAETYAFPNDNLRATP